MKTACLALVACTLSCGGGNAPSHDEPVPAVQQAHSSPLAVSPDGARLFVAHPDADSVTILDAHTHALLRETPLAATPPVTSADGRFDPAVAPRALALNGTGSTLYVTGQRSGAVYALNAESGKIVNQATICSEPIGVLVSSDDETIFVACSQDDEIAELDANDLSIVTTVTCPRKPWALAWSSDGQSLIATHLLGPGISRLGTAPLSLQATTELEPGPPQGDEFDSDPTVPHGVVRGIYDALVRPGTSELWVAHMMLGIDTPQPELDFQRTVFPSLSILDDGARQVARLSVMANPGDGGAFGDIVSGPRALAFSDDGALLFVADADSEDVLVIDAERRVETELIRPLPGHLPEGIVWAGGKLYVQERNTEDIAAFVVTRTSTTLSIGPDGPAFPTLTADPMPADLRLGQKLFYSANSDDVPVTQNHWVACASCHLEGRSDAVTWLFSQGARDTPTNAGGMLDTGFLFRTADRREVQDYFRTINVEQGGHFDGSAAQQPLLDALAAFVNHAIPTPVPPSTDASHALSGSALADLRARGETVFEHAGCPTCHRGPAKTDSAAGNPTLDLAGTVVLHDVGTCLTTGPAPDVSHEDIAGDPREACAFDTPALRGLWDSSPYLHDGSAATLDDAVTKMLAASSSDGDTQLSPDDRAALVEYLRGL